MWQKLWQNKLIILVLLGLLVRVYAILQPAHPYDIGTYHAWGNILLNKGAQEFYATTWSDYLPFPTYLFGLTSWLTGHLQLEFSVIFKTFFTLLELGLLTWIFRLLKPRKSKGLWTIIFALTALSPALIGDTSWWGQTDTLPALLTILALIYFRKHLSHPGTRHLFLTSTLFSLAVAFKPIVLLTLPVFLVLYFTHDSRPPFLPLFLSSIWSLVLFTLFALPVAGNLKDAFFFLFDKALEQASTYPFLSINAYNLWTIRSQFDSWPPDSTMVLGLSAHNFGQLLFALLSARLFWLWRRANWSGKYALRVAATLLVTFFAITTRMHERHLMFGLLLLTFSTLQARWLLFPSLLLTLTFTANLYAAYYWMFHAQSWPFSLTLARALSWLNVIVALGLNLSWHWPSSFARIRSWLTRHRPLVLILLLATTLRFIGLNHPTTHVFDEVYHAFTAEELVKNNPAAWEWWNTPPEGFAYEWTHPPVAKYGMVAGLLLFGDSPFGWRFFSAVMGVICLYGFYRLARLLFKKSTLALTVTFLLSISGLHLVQSRIGMNDIYMLSFLVWSLVFALNKRWKYAAILYGLALASKWSALYGLLPLAVTYLHHYSREFRSRPLVHLVLVLRLLVVSVLTYFLLYSPFFASHTWEQFLELHRQMWYYHTNLVATHAYQSTPKEWIFSLRPVWYWVEYAKNPSYLYVQGNPLLLWTGLAALALTIRKWRHFSYLLPVSAYLAFLVPWLFSPRIMFFYHYLPSAAFLTLSLAAWLHSLSSRTRQVLLVGIVLSFLLLTPVYYGYPTSQAYWDTLFALFPTWK